MAPGTSRDRRPGTGRRRAVAVAGVALVVVGLAVGVSLVPEVSSAGTSDPARSSRPDGTSAPAASTTSATPTPTPTPTGPPATPTPTGPPPFDRGRSSIDDANSVWVVVDKLRPLNPLEYAPADLVEVGDGHQLRAEAAEALGRMFADASAAGLPLEVDSAYRSYAYQQNTFASAVARLGEEQALRASARPGYSEHQTGLAADIGGGGCAIEPCFADTAEGRWAAENAYRYGFVIRYPDGAEGVTGYKYEPWHVRYVGVELATEMRTEGVATLEEFFGLPAAPSYAG